MLKARSLTIITLALFGGCAAPPGADPAAGDAHNPDPVVTEYTAPCPPPGQWILAGESEPLSSARLLDEIEDAQVILLGERHDSADDHRWQLQMFATLQGRQDGMVVGFEMFNRNQQAALDNWVQGKLTQEAFLEAVDWDGTWGYPAELYLPLLHFIRLNRVPAIALNIERDLLQRIGREGWDAVPLSERHQISAAKPGPPGYDAMLDGVMASHAHGGAAVTEADKAAFRRAQSAWDKAMAQAIAKALEKHEGPVVGIVGRGHMQWGYGIPYQLEDMGIEQVVTLLPVSAGDACMDADLPPAQGLFGLPPAPVDRRENKVELTARDTSRLRA